MQWPIMIKGKTGFRSVEGALMEAEHLGRGKGKDEKKKHWPLIRERKNDLRRRGRNYLSLSKKKGEDGDVPHLGRREKEENDFSTNSSREGSPPSRKRRGGGSPPEGGREKGPISYGPCDEGGRGKKE